MHNPLFLLPLLAVATTAYPGFNQPRQEPSGTPYPGNCKWNALGCWIDPAGTRLLTTVKYYDDALTIEKCLTRCEGYKYAMVEYKRECYCGDTLNPAGGKASESECSLSCMGDATQKCGGSLRGNLYQVNPNATSCPSSTVTSSTPTVPATCTAVTVTVGPSTCEAATETVTSTSIFTVDAQTVTETATSTLDAVTVTETKISTFLSTTTITAIPSSSTTIPSPPSTTSSTPTSCIPNPTPLSNGDFELQAAWSSENPPNISTGAQYVTNNVYTGTRAFQLRIAVGVTNSVSEFALALRQTLKVCPGSSYALRAYAKTVDVNAGCTLTWVVDGTTVAVQAFAGVGYELVQGVWTAPGGVVAPVFRVTMRCVGVVPSTKMLYLDAITFDRV